ncbi:hypothetical protein E2C01_082964 [Portunus trituberculatus]|uniref:Thyroglobulin type-1 domain-containing protein n=1 Tax=Portunus trituberculatus TaxID=210409 RepID=A0A5B7J6I6_PORTR|nr:hypothetical protein [Portunus trituberculatus]
MKRDNTYRRARDLGLDVNTLPHIDCDNEGGFAPIQCQGDRCFCVDQRTGLEKPGTRAPTLELVNCSAECGGIRTYAWTSARSHADHLIHYYATASLALSSFAVF